MAAGFSCSASQAAVPLARTSATSSGVGPKVARRSRCQTGSVPSRLGTAGVGEGPGVGVLVGLGLGLGLGVGVGVGVGDALPVALGVGMGDALLVALDAGV